MFRNGTQYDNKPTAKQLNRNLIQSINAVRDLGEWPAAAGGGEVAEPESLAVLGDLTEFYVEEQADAFRHFYDPSFPGGLAYRHSTAAASKKCGLQY